MVKWYLVDMDSGIIDEAETKHKLMVRNAYTTSRRCGTCYEVFGDCNDGIGGSAYIIKENDMKKNGFGWALQESEVEG